MYEQLVEREKKVKAQEASVSSALGERERALQARQDQLATELQDRERRLRSHEDECLATDRHLTAEKASLDRARQVMFTGPLQMNACLKRCNVQSL